MTIVFIDAHIFALKENLENNSKIPTKEKLLLVVELNRIKSDLIKLERRYK